MNKRPITGGKNCLQYGRKPNKKLKMAKKHTKSGKKDPSINVGQSAAQQQQGEQFLSMHRSIQTLPLNRFIECYVDGNLHALVISGVAVMPVLQQVWEDILQEYTERVAHHEYKLYLSLLREITDLRITHKQIQLLAHAGDEANEIPKGALRQVYDKYLAGELNGLLKTTFRLNWADQKTYNQELDKAVRRSGSIKIKADLKAMQFEAIRKRHEKRLNEQPTKAQDRAYFTNILISLSDHAKFQIADTITVYEYCERIKRLNEYCEQFKTLKR